MNNPITERRPLPKAQDSTVLRSTIIKLTATQKILSASVIVVVALIWWDLLNRLIAFGRGIDYSGLSALGLDTIALIQQYNPFFWWTLVVICTFIIAYFLYRFTLYTHVLWQRRSVDETVFAELIKNLSASACEVINWAWHDRRHPITVGDLQRAANELRSGRFSKISLAEQHAALVDAGRKRTETDENNLQSVEFHV
ncbi:hypothetical protein L1889_16240 [Paenalcaligenes niemegkensis]|uniref:hypothetical protein n=1 Tax=Paenalcaligenes niemegkensis TaxID=2895469 RepID=UPI001EE85C39|nr:hypothetical protein [Paenalcaligenes niemegkensis]MCQ9618025.1 hypothetical protein [Paenalcaligenes niemegkensis]